MRVTQSVQRQLINEFWAMNAPATGERKGPRKERQAQIGNTKVRSIGVHMSEMLAPKVVKGVQPNRPAKNRHASCVSMFGANADAVTKSMNIDRLMMYTGFLPTVSEKGALKSDPMPRATRHKPVASDSVTLLAPNSFPACSMIEESIAEDQPIRKPVDLTIAVEIHFSDEANCADSAGR